MNLNKNDIDLLKSWSKNKDWSTIKNQLYYLMTKSYNNKYLLANEFEVYSIIQKVLFAVDLVSKSAEAWSYICY